MFRISCFFHIPEESSLGSARSGVDGPSDVLIMKNESAWKHCYEDLHGNQCCMSSLLCPVGNTANQADKDVTYFTLMVPAWLYTALH